MAFSMSSRSAMMSSRASFAWSIATKQPRQHCSCSTRSPGASSLLSSPLMLSTLPEHSRRVDIVSSITGETTTILVEDSALFGFRDGESPVPPTSSNDANILFSVLAKNMTCGSRMIATGVPVNVPKSPQEPCRHGTTYPMEERQRRHFEKIRLLPDIQVLHPAWNVVRRAFSSSSLASAFSDSNESDDNRQQHRTPFLLADIGEGIKEVELLNWYVKPGDSVMQFDRICEVQSDKATVEITSRYDGTVLELAGNVGDMIQVGHPLLFLEQNESDHHADASRRSATPTHAHGTPPIPNADASLNPYQSSGSTYSVVHPRWHDTERLQIPTIASHYQLKSDLDDTYEEVTDTLEDGENRWTSVASSSSFLASPAVRKLGKEYHLDLNTVHPSGPHGRLLKSDVVTYLIEQGKWKVNQFEDAGGRWDAPTYYGSTASATEISPSTTAQTTTTDTPLDEIVQLKGYHRLMAQTMTASLQIPHMCFGDEIVVTRLLECRRQINDLMILPNGTTTSTDSTEVVPVSLLAMLIKACSLALTQHPMVNATVHDAAACQLKVSSQHNIGIAVDTPRGLVVPVLRNVQTLNLVQIQRAINDVKVKAREYKLANDDLVGATFTLSNIGVIGGTYMQPVIVPPQLAMGAIGRVQTLPRFVNRPSSRGNGNNSSTEGQAYDVVPTDVLHVSWAGDHRFLDGATLARFHSTFKRFVEHPSLMLTQMT